MTHALLRYGDLTARGIAGGRAGLNVDSAAVRAAARSEKKIKAIVAANDCTNVACMVERTSETTQEGHGRLLIQPAASPAWSSGYSRSARRVQNWRSCTLTGLDPLPPKLQV